MMQRHGIWMAYSYKAMQQEKYPVACFALFRDEFASTVKYGIPYTVHRTLMFEQMIIRPEKSAGK